MGRPKSNEREDIRNLVLEKAKALFVSEGYNNITIRKIAKAIGYTPATIYLYFSSKNEILFELHNEGFKLLYQYKMRVNDHEEPLDALEKLCVGGRLYIDFALDNPDYYELMFNMPEPHNYMAQNQENQPVDYAMRAYTYLRESIQECKSEGYFAEVTTDTATFTFWSLVHGIVSLIIRKRVPYPQAPTHQLAQEAIDFVKELIASQRFTTDIRDRLRWIEKGEKH